MALSYDPHARPLPALVALVFNQVSADLVEHVHAAGYDDLQLHHLLNVFRFLEPGGTRPATLARAAGVTPQAMSLALNELVRRRYVERRPDPSDRRATLVVLAERGSAVGVLVEEWWHALETQWAELVGERDLATTRAVLAAVVTADGAATAELGAGAARDAGAGAARDAGARAAGDAGTDPGPELDADPGCALDPEVPW